MAKPPPHPQQHPWLQSPEPPRALSLSLAVCKMGTAAHFYSYSSHGAPVPLEAGCPLQCVPIPGPPVQPRALPASESAPALLGARPPKPPGTDIENSLQICSQGICQAGERGWWGWVLVLIGVLAGSYTPGKEAHQHCLLSDHRQVSVGTALSGYDQQPWAFPAGALYVAIGAVQGVQMVGLGLLPPPCSYGRGGQQVVISHPPRLSVALLYKPVDRVTRSTLVLHVSHRVPLQP